MNDSTLPLQTITESGTAPKSRVKDADDCYNLSECVLYADRERQRTNATHRGMFDGRAPYSEPKLRSEAQAWRANVNFREAKSASSAALVPYYDLFSGARYYSSVVIPADNPFDREYFSDVVSEEFHQLLKNYKGFDFNMQQMLTDFIRYGKGFLVWEDTENWQFKCVEQMRVAVPNGTDAYSGNLEVLVIRKALRVHELWNAIRDRKIAGEKGWNVGGVLKALSNAMPEDNQSRPYDYQFIEKQMNDRDILNGYKVQTVNVRVVFVKELSGKVSHYIVEDPRPQKDKSDNQGNNYLYEALEEYDDFDQLICPFFLETNDGSWNGASGLGKDIYPIMALKDRTKCAMVDLMFIRTGINLQARNANAAKTASLIRTGTVNIIPPDFDVQQSTILGDIESPVLVDRVLDMVVTNNTGVYKQRMDRVEGNPRTATEITMQNQTQATLSNSGVNRFYLTLDRLYQETYRRAVKPILASDTAPWAVAAREFQSNCQRRGVPIAAMRKPKSVTAYRNAGNGSITMRKQNIAETMPFVPMMPENGRQNFIRWAISAINGQSMAENFVPLDETKRIPADQQSLAMLENAAIKVGAPVGWTDTQNDVVHAQTHLAAGAQAAQSVQQGGNPMEIASFLEGIGSHTAVHLSKLQGDPTRSNEFKALQEQWAQLAKVHDKLLQQVGEIQKMQQEQQAASQKATAIMANQDPNAMVAQAQAMQDMKIKGMKAKGDMARRNQKMQHDAVRERQNLAINDARAASEIAIAKRKADAETEIRKRSFETEQ